MYEFNVLDQIKKFKDFLSESSNYEGVPYSVKINQKNDHIVIDFLEFIKHSQDLAESLMESAEETLKAFELAANDIKDDKEHKIKVRFKNVEQIESCNVRIRDIRVRDYDKFVVVSGVIRHISDIYGEVVFRKYECPSCGNVLNVIQKRFESLAEPTKCGCGRKGRFTLLSDEKIDSQRMVLEEEFESLDGNQQPNKIDIIIQHGLTSKDIEKFNTLGSRVSITGIIMSRPKYVKGKITNELEKYIEANYIRQLEEKYKEIEITGKDIELIKEYSAREDLLDICMNNVAPHISGYNEVKKAIVLQLYGGVTGVDSKSKKKIRGDSHILLIGDPSTGKTQLAKSVEKVALKYRYCSGVRTSKAGMTVTLTKDDFTNQWGMEAGAVILANKGICVMDEFDKMSDDDRDALHEAMEQQQITLDKANIHTVLKAETSILACANWKHSRYDPNEDMYSQIDMPDSLISRFDLFFVFIDRPNLENDTRVMKHVLRSRTNGLYDELVHTHEVIENEMWKKHIIHCKNFNPKMSKEAADRIVQYYTTIRTKSQQQDRKIIPITSRQGEAIQRLAEASARMHLRDVTTEDVNTAISLIEYSLRSIAFDQEHGVFDVDVIETGMSSKKRNFLHDVRKAIDDLSIQYKQIPVDELMGKFNKDESRQVEEVLAQMSKQGDIFEPRRGFISKL